MELRRAADRLGWGWVVTAAVAAPWLGQGGAPCPPEGPPPGTGCLLVIYGPDLSLLVVAFLGALGLLLDQRYELRRLSGATLVVAGCLAGAWATTHQFLGSAWHVPRSPVVLLLTVPPLLVAAERFTRGLRGAAPSSPVRSHGLRT